MSDDLVAWLSAQLDEDERVARRAGGIRDLEWTYDRETFHVISGRGQSIAARKLEGNPINDVDGEHMARHDPARVLAEVGAKRKVVDAYVDAVRMHRLMTETGDDGKWDWLFKSEALEGVVRLLALPYADRPGYREEWRPAE